MYYCINQRKTSNDNLKTLIKPSLDAVTSKTLSFFIPGTTTMLLTLKTNSHKSNVVNNKLSNFSSQENTKLQILTKRKWDACKTLKFSFIKSDKIKNWPKFFFKNTTLMTRAPVYFKILLPVTLLDENELKHYLVKINYFIKFKMSYLLVLVSNSDFKFPDCTSNILTKPPNPPTAKMLGYRNQS